MKRIGLIIGFVLATHCNAWAQGGQTVVIKGTDGASTFNVGDATNTAIRIGCVIGCPATKTDRGAVTLGTDALSLSGGVYDDTAAALSVGMAAVFRETSRRALHINLRDANGNEIGVSGSPLVVSAQGGSFAVTGTFWQATQPVSAASLPLPSGAATETTVAGIKTGTDRIPAQGQALSSASLPVVLPAAQITTLTPPAAITGFALEAGHLAAIDTATAKIPALGQALAAGSVPVVLTASQLSTLTPPAAISGFATETTLAGQQVSQGSTTSGQKGELVQGAVSTSAPTYTNGQTSPLSLDPNGNLRVAVTGGGSNAAAGATGSSVPASASYTAYNSGGNLVGVSTSNRFPVTCDNCGGGSGGTSATDNGTYTASTSAGTPIMGAVDDTSTTAASEDKLGIVRITPQRGEHVNLRTAAGVETGVAAAPLQVSLANTGTNATAVKVDGSGVTQPVSGTVAIGAGSAVIGHVIADSGSTTAVTGNVTVVGAAASGAAKSGNPVQTGGVFNTTQPTVTNGQVVENQSTARGAQIVAPGVDNFAVQAAQSGTWNITNVSGTVSLPTGAATLAEQQTQTTALQLIDNLPVTQGSTTSGQSGVLAQAAVTTAAPTYTNAQTSPLSQTTKGGLRVGVFDSGGTDASDATAHAIKMLPVDATGTVIAPSTLATHDSTLGTVTSVTGGISMFRAESSAPADVTAGDAVLPYADLKGRLHTICDSGCSGGTTDTDDGTIAAAQSTGLSLGLMQVFDGTNWKRWTIGTAGTASAQVVTIQGIASMTPVLATLSGTNNINNISGTVSLPTGAATAAKQPALGTAGSASSDVLTVQGIASMTALKVDGSAVTQPISASSLPLPTSAATSTKQSDGSQKTQIVDGSGNVIGSTSNSLNVQCANCSGSGVSAADEATFTAGTSAFAAGGGFFQTTATSNALTNGQYGAFQVTANRALFSNLRNASGTEIGTSTTPIQVSLANTATNSTAVKVDNSAVTQPISASSLPLPTGAATSAKQPALGTAGSAASDVITVQGIASMTALKVDGSGVTQPVSVASNLSVVGAAASGAAKSGNPVQTGAVFNTTQPTVTNGQVVENQATARGAQIVATGVDTFNVTVNAALPAGSNVIGALTANQSVNNAQVSGTSIATGNGTVSAGVQRVAIASDNTAFSVQPVPGTSGGLTPFVLEPTASDNHAVIKNGAGQVYHIVAFNNSATVNYYRLYDAGTGFNGCNSATNLKWEGHIPASTSDAGFVEDIAQGISFSTGISICVTGGFGQTNTTNATASAISLNIGYK